MFINYVMKPLAKCAEEGLSCTTNDNRFLLFQSMIASHIPDIPEAEDLLIIKRGNQTTMPCHM